MKILVVSSLALAVLTGAALAQAAPPDAPPAAMGMKPPPPPPPGGPGGMEDDGPDGPPRWEGRRGHHPPPPPKAAHFRIEHGDTALDIKCADDEPMKACADFTLQLLDKLQTMPRP